jgi:DNA-binding MarR family transcriptional regulator
MVKLFDSQTISPDDLVGLVSALVRAEHRHAAFFAQRLDLPTADTLALYHLANEPLRSRELADRLGLTPGSVTALVDRLMARKLARRIPHETDRRVVLIELTKAGHAETWKVLRHFIGDVVRISTERSASHAQIIGGFLGELIAAIDDDTERLRSIHPKG